MTLEGMAYKFTVSGTIVENSQQDFYTKINNIRCALISPRQVFTANWASDEEGNTDGNFIIAVCAAGDGVSNPECSEDIDWGPIPSNIKITEFIAGRAANYSWTLSTKLKECWNGPCSDDIGDFYPYILSLTTKWTHVIDSVGLTTRTVSGKLVLDSYSVSELGSAADTFRNYVLPSLPTWFKPERQEYTQSENGRVLTFSVSQQEKYWTLPVPAAEGQASMNVHLEQAGALAVITFNGSFTVPNSTNYGKLDLLNIVANLINDRMQPYYNAGLTFILISSDIKDDIYSGKIDFNISFQLPSGVAAASFTPSTPPGLVVTVLTGPVGNAPPDSTGISQYIGPYGGDGVTYDSGVIAAVPSPFDNCTGNLPTSGDATNTNIPSGLGINNGGGNSSSSDDSSIYQTSQGISAAHAAAQFFEHHEIISFELDNGWVPFYPKISTITTPNTPTVLFQQVRPPKLTIIQAGYSSRVSNTSSNGPVVPPPFFASGQKFSVVRSASITPEVPVPIGTGQVNKYTVHWKYIIDVAGPFTTFNSLNIAYPVDPRTNPSGSATDPYNGTDVGESFATGQLDIISVTGTSSYIPVLEPG
jgi:hypothetical protein